MDGLEKSLVSLKPGLLGSHGKLEALVVILLQLLGGSNSEYVTKIAQNLGAQGILSKDSVKLLSNGKFLDLYQEATEDFARTRNNYFREFEGILDQFADKGVVKVIRQQLLGLSLSYFNRDPRGPERTSVSPSSFGDDVFYRSQFEEILALGKGGFGSVHLVKSKVDGGLYAAKVISVPFKGHSAKSSQNWYQRVRKILGEIRVLSNISRSGNKNVCRYHYGWIEPAQVMDLPFDQFSQVVRPRNRSGNNVTLEVEEDDTSSSSELESGSEDEDEGRAVGFLDDDIEIESSRDITLEPSSMRSESGSESGLEDGPVAAQDFFGRDDRTVEQASEIEMSMLNESCVESDEEETESDNETSSGVNDSYDHNVGTELVRVSGSGSANSVLRGMFQALHFNAKVYILMEFCGLYTLRHWIDDQRGSNVPPAWDEIVSIMRQVVEAIVFMHRMGILHRDLKPANIFLSTERGVDVDVKVGDFGLARPMRDVVVDGPDTPNTPSASSNFDFAFGDDITAPLSSNVGTAYYAAPEQLLSADYGSKADIYSLGLILFDMCIPVPTFSERNSLVHALFGDPGREHFGPKVTSAQRNSVYDALNKLHPRLHQMLKSMLESDPELRPSADELFADGLLSSRVGDFLDEETPSITGSTVAGSESISSKGDQDEELRKLRLENQKKDEEILSLKRRLAGLEVA